MAGQVFGVQPIIRLNDIYGNSPEVFTPVSLSLFSDSLCTSPISSSSYLSGNTNTTSSSGLAIFETFKSTKSGIFYLGVSAGSSAACLSNPIEIASQSPSSVSFFRDAVASSLSAGSLFTQQPIVSLQDQYGNPVKNQVIFLTAKSDVSCLVNETGILSQASNTTDEFGLATFTGVSFSKTAVLHLQASYLPLNLRCCSGNTLVIVPGVASNLTWLSLDLGASAAAGVSFTTPVIVLLSDSYGNPIAGAISTLSFYTDPSCSVLASDVGLSSITATTNSTGYATIENYLGTKAGSYYRKVLASGISTACSSSKLTITTAQISSISFTSQPSGPGVAGVAFPGQPSLRLMDSYGNAINNSAVSLSAFITLDCSTTAASGALTPSSETSSVLGIVSFTNLKYTGATVIYIKAASSGYTACSAAVLVSPSTPASLVWTIDIISISATAGSIFSSQPQLSLTDQYGNTVGSVDVFLSFYSDSGCSNLYAAAGLSGNNITTDSSGSATFSSLAATAVGTYYVKASTSTGINSSCSSAALSVTFGSASSIQYSTQPYGTAIAGVVFPTQPILRVLDAYGNPITGSSVSVAPYDALCGSLKSGSLSTSSVATNSTGYAVFTLLSYNTAETIYLKASIGGSLFNFHNHTNVFLV